MTRPRSRGSASAAVLRWLAVLARRVKSFGGAEVADQATARAAQLAAADKA